MPPSSSEWWPLVICAVLPVGNISTRYKSLQRNNLPLTFFLQGKKIQCAKRRCGRHGLSWAPNIQVNRSLPHVFLLMIDYIRFYITTRFPLLIILGSTSSFLYNSRFYIKCTACVSEICFRTDPESCDYVLEAGDENNIPLRYALKK